VNTQELLDLWYRCLIDHHKDKDCHFYIEQHWCCYKKMEWRVQHYGYVSAWDNDSFIAPSYEVAVQKLNNALVEMIQEECARLIENSEDAGYTRDHKEIATEILTDLKGLLSEQLQV